jgi:type I restriction enzyme, S subunit
MSDKSKLAQVPKLRFPEFQHSGEWTTEKLGSLVSISTEKVGNNNCVPMSITSGVGLVSQEDKFGRVIAGDSYKNYLLLKPFDFAYNKSATKEYPEGFLTLYNGEKLAAVPNSIFTCFRVNGASPYPQYLNYLFSGNLHGQWLRKFIQVGARAHGSLSINDGDLLALPVPLPSGQSSLKEQQKIADCLRSLDELISAQVRKVDALKTHKKGLMQQLFPREGETQPRLRFPEFRGAGEWEAKKLGQFAKYTKGFAFKSEDYKNEGVRIIRVSDLGADFIKPNNEKLYISSESEHEYVRYKLTASEIIVTTVGSKPEIVDSAVGRGIYVKLNNEGLLNQNLLKLEVLSGVNSRFLFSHINTPEYQRFIASISRGNANQANIAVKDLMAFTIKAPKYAEQHRIADVLTSLDDLITAQTQELETLKTHKKGLMQQLFPSEQEVAA